MKLSHISYALMVLSILSFVFTAYQIFIKLLIHKYRRIMINKIISFIEKGEGKAKIIATLTKEGYPEEEISLKYDEVKNIF